MDKKSHIAILGILFLAPLTFIVSCVVGHPLFPDVLGNPVVLFASLFAPMGSSLWAVSKIRILPGDPKTLDATVQLRPAFVLIVATGLLICGVLATYLILENVRS